MIVIPTSNDHDQVVMQPVDKDPVIPEDVIKDHPPRLSKNMKLSMRHLDKIENAIEVSEEWKYVDGEAVPPEGRDPSVSYTKAEETKYSDYGSINVEEVEPYGPNDPAGEVCENLSVTDGTMESNDDTDFVEAVPVLALNRAQQNLVKTQGRRGEIDTDPINNENFLDRPGMEVKTSETYLAQLESESEDDSEEETETPPAETPPSENTETPPAETPPAETPSGTEESTPKTTRKYTKKAAATTEPTA